MTVQRYTRPAIALHWLIALLILTLGPLGLYMSDLPLSPQKLHLYAWHKWLGLTVLTLAVLRAAWRLRHPAPPLPASVPRWQQHMADALHLALYAMIFIVPLSGWALSSAAGVPIVWWGVLPVPALLAPDQALAERLASVHGWLNAALFGMVAAHIGAALKHQFIDRDRVLERMLPGRPSQE